MFSASAARCSEFRRCPERRSASGGRTFHRGTLRRPASSPLSRSLEGSSIWWSLRGGTKINQTSTQEFSRRRPIVKRLSEVTWFELFFFLKVKVAVGGENDWNDGNLETSKQDRGSNVFFCFFKEWGISIFSFGVFGFKYFPCLSLLFLEKALSRLTDLASLIPPPHTISVTWTIFLCNCEERRGLLSPGRPRSRPPTGRAKCGSPGGCPASTPSGWYYGKARAVT